MDGTLVNCTKLQTHILQQLFDTFNVDTFALDLTKLIGPPLSLTFAKYFGQENVDAAFAKYKELYVNTQVHSITLMPGIQELLANLKFMGYRIFVSSLQIQSVVQKELEHLDILQYFDAVYGDNIDKPYSSKAEVIKSLITNINLDPAQCVMIGDTDNDLLGGMHNGITAIGVMWGYGKHAFNDIQYTANDTNEVLSILQQL